ncbi:MAG: S41 family peptidase [Bacteroidales bacterium]|nr:S41 family peptidase [Bacteroidales bacterium]MDD7404588.1 S41 family peptidase [Bacteroidales bacterium]MDY2931230.1 S41 family peptidase [Muribaculaceae bacterium]
MKKILYILLLAAVAQFASAEEFTPAQKLRMAEYAIEKFYVDDVNSSELVENAIKGMLEHLDPHSSYTDPEETSEMTEQLDGEFEGIGIQFQMKEDTLYVIQTIAGGPSERVGILAGDRIVMVNDTAIAGVKMKQRDIMKRLRGKKGTMVEVLVKRGNENISFRIKRDKIPVTSIDAAYMIAPGVGYIRLSRFGEKSYQEFMEKVKLLKKQGMERLIFDLSDNGGGYLNSATQLANEFLSAGNLIVYTEGRRSSRHATNATGFGSLKDMKIAVVVNQYSASASEIFSGAIQDWDRGVVVGRRTFGKGLVQRPFPFADGSLIRLTIARYYTPSGRCIQKPYDKGNDAYARDIIDRYNNGELTSADSIHFPDSLRYTTLRSKRVIYGGGGIMPDRFVPFDTTQYTKYYRSLVAKGVINTFSVNYVDKNRKQLKRQYKTEEDFCSRFSVSDDMVEELTQLGLREKVEINKEELKTSAPLIRRVLKSMIARDLWTMDAYFRVYNEENDIVQEALRIISDDALYDRVLNEGATRNTDKVSKNNDTY